MPRFVVACVLACALLACATIPTTTARRGRSCRKKPVTPASAAVVKTPLPSESNMTLPVAWDWRAATGPSGTGNCTRNYCSRVLTQQEPRVCGSCWAEAATGALTDRFSIATDGSLNVQLAPQVLLNFIDSMGDCMGGDSYDAYNFIHAQGITDDTCAPFTGQALSWGFDYVGGSQEDDSYDISHMCQTCDWEGECKWVPAADYDVYHVSEFGQVGGPKAGTFEKRAQAMMAEIYARGPIACGIASDPDSFDLYTGGVITDPSKLSDEDVDHVIVLAGWGVSEDGVDFWVGRNSYGGRWGEGAGGGWFRVARGNNTLAIESDACSWAVPHPASVKRAMAQQYASVAV